MEIKVLSDLHLEFKKEYKMEGNKNIILVLAGDIGYPKSNEYISFINESSIKFHSVILITGNHEYYNSEISEINDYIKTFTKKLDNVYFLNNETIEIGEYIFWGGTFWSFIPPELFYFIKQKISDFRYISNLSNEYYNQLHKESVQSVLKFIKDQNPKKKIIVTHHAPLFQDTSHPMYNNNITNYVFASDQSKLIKPPIYLWIFGHTHFSTSFIFNGVKIVSNCYGYKGENTNYSPELTLS